MVESRSDGSTLTLALKRLLKAVVGRENAPRLRSTIERMGAPIGRLLFFAQRKAVLIWRTLSGRKQGAGSDFAMLCVYVPIYVRLAIASINSLHLQNPDHRIELYMDRTCLDVFQASRNRLDYPYRVKTKEVSTGSSSPWQFVKLEVVFAAAARGSIFVDADSRWHDDPEPFLLKDRAIFLVKVNDFAKVAAERKLVKDGLGLADWAHLIHLSTGLVAIPPRLFSQHFAQRCKELAWKIYKADGMEALLGDQLSAMRRLCEEIALSITAQEVIGKDLIATLKESDGPGDHRIIESYYYGALHGVN